MPTLAEAATLSLHGLDLEKYQGITIDSSPRDQLEVIHTAMVGYAQAHNFDVKENDEGVVGYVGPLSFTKLYSALFRTPDISDNDFLRVLKLVSGAGRRYSAFKTLDYDKHFRLPRAERERTNPTWWIADELDLSVTRKRTKSTNVSHRINSVARREKFLRIAKDLGSGFDYVEMNAIAGETLSAASTREMLDKLVEEGQLVSRAATHKDRQIMRTRPSLPGVAKKPRKVYAHPDVEEALGGIVVLPMTPESEQDNDYIAPPAPDPHFEAQEPGNGNDESSAPAIRTVLLNEDDVKRMNLRVGELELINSKLLTACNELLSVVNIMKGSDK